MWCQRLSEWSRCSRPPGSLVPPPCHDREDAIVDDDEAVAVAVAVQAAGAFSNGELDQTAQRTLAGFRAAN